MGEREVGGTDQRNMGRGLRRDDAGLTDSPLLEIRNLRTWFHTNAGIARAVDGVDLTINRGETLGLVGESGCGKSVTALSIMGLIDPPGRIERESVIEFEGRNLLSLSAGELRSIRGNRIAMIFQEPMTALNPVFTVGDQVAEVARVHSRDGAKAAWNRAVEMLALTGIPDAGQRAREYPHQLSGGMRQRVLIAMALMMKPSLIIADEPTTALDVTIQAQVLELLRDLQKKTGTAILLITHDLGVIAEMADRVAVMYAGQVVEETSVATLFREAHHPYTRGLMEAIPSLRSRRERLKVIPGTVPPATQWPSGCRFRDRCEHAWEKCADQHPALFTVSENHSSRCHLVHEPERRTRHRAAVAEGE